ncbi:hypothetical protein EG68_01561 [Paragonimus skrjabini miyazakii]|uniref:Uncharacterized protein n=1 Tax=Paragonimus skrjabini miyazakii TaxID=59628 RepID=A0A8S9ZC33_9TREM|nr:hypothetical protein EG68_01561 [Paragonimus skrjabini miyazakii]
MDYSLDEIHSSKHDNQRKILTLKHVGLYRPFRLIEWRYCLVIVATTSVPDRLDPKLHRGCFPQLNEGHNNMDGLTSGPAFPIYINKTTEESILKAYTTCF